MKYKIDTTSKTIEILLEQHFDKNTGGLLCNHKDADVHHFFNFSKIGKNKSRKVG